MADIKDALAKWDAADELLQEKIEKLENMFIRGIKSINVEAGVYTKVCEVDIPELSIIFVRAVGHGVKICSKDGSSVYAFNEDSNGRPIAQFFTWGSTTLSIYAKNDSGGSVKVCYKIIS